MSAKGGAPCDALWDQLVDRHIDSVWRIATGAGLDEHEAATLTQLIYLRMAERWPTTRALANARPPGEDPLDQPATQLDEWIRDTARHEAEAWVGYRQTVRRYRGEAAQTVVRLGPGFAPPADRPAGDRPDRETRGAQANGGRSASASIRDERARQEEPAQRDQAR